MGTRKDVVLQMRMTANRTCVAICWPRIQIWV